MSKVSDDRTISATVREFLNWLNVDERLISAFFSECSKPERFVQDAR